MDWRAIKNITSYVGRSLPAYFPGKKREKKNDQVQKVQRKKKSQEILHLFCRSKTGGFVALNCCVFWCGFFACSTTSRLAWRTKCFNSSQKKQVQVVWIETFELEAPSNSTGMKWSAKNHQHTNFKACELGQCISTIKINTYTTHISPYLIALIYTTASFSWNTASIR